MRTLRFRSWVRPPLGPAPRAPHRIVHCAAVLSFQRARALVAGGVGAEGGVG